MSARVIGLVAAVVSAGLLAAGCASPSMGAARDVAVPARLTAVPLPTDTSGTAAPGDRVQSLRAASVVESDWWRGFGDSRVDALVTRALANNPTLAAAQATLRQAHELAAVQAAASWPTLGLGFSALRTHGAQAGIVDNAAPGARTLLLSGSYAPDLFGANAHATDAARAQEDAARQALRAARLQLAGDVVDALAARDAALRQLRGWTQLVALDAEVSAIVAQRQRLGDVPMSAVWAQAQAAGDRAASLAAARLQAAQAQALLASLEGVAPADFEDAEGDVAWRLPDIPARLPGDVVCRRPDVRQAAAQLRSADAGLQAALASRLPQVVLTGDTGYGVGVAGRLLNPANFLWDVGVSVTQSLFDGGAQRHRSAAAQALVDADAAQYRATVIGAFKDVAGALDAVRHDAHADVAAIDRADAARRQWEIAARGQALGDVARQDVLVAQAQAIAAGILQDQARAARVMDAANAFVALGGGDDADAACSPPASPSAASASIPLAVSTPSAAERPAAGP